MMCKLQQKLVSDVIEARLVLILLTLSKLKIILLFLSLWAKIPFKINIKDSRALSMNPVLVSLNRVTRCFEQIFIFFNQKIIVKIYIFKNLVLIIMSQNL